MPLLSNLALALGLIVNPWLLARNLCRNADTVLTLAIAGVCLVSTGVAAPVLLHLVHIPISAGPLTVFHVVVFTIVLILSLLRDIRLRPTTENGSISSAFSPMGFMAAGFALLVIPFTPIAGIDTYKWQDLAGAVKVERSVPWLIHPVSLLGFTPRSYPSAQPLLLASISILSGASVDWSSYLLSLVSGAIGLTSATALARHVFTKPSTSLWMAFLYVFSPVFLRYNFWATGRGLFMALLPLFALGLLHKMRGKTLLAAAWCAILLCLSHKAGMVAVAAIPIAFLAGVLFFPPAPSATHPPKGLALIWRMGLPCLFALASLGAGFMLAQYSPLNMAVRLATRLAFLFPFSLIGLPFVFLPVHGTPAGRAMTMMALFALPAVCTDFMYGSLIAVLFVAYPAAIGLDELITRIPPHSHRCAYAAIVAAVMIPAVTIIVHQSADSPSRDVVRAARFLNQLDPLGPYRIEAPGRTRTRMQAYLDGCPRFNVFQSRQPALKPMPFPLLTGPVHKDVRDITNYLRQWIVLPDTSTDWYGSNPKVYFITVAGEGKVPPGARLLFTSGNVSVYDGPSEP